MVCAHPDSNHDAFILCTSDVWHWFKNAPAAIDRLVLGDSGYMTRSWLMTLFQNPITEAQQRYNNAHTGTLIGIEQLFGQWKRRFMILHNDIRVPRDRVSSIISACAVLHNIAKDNIF
jgi:hypothetical protein